MTEFAAFILFITFVFCLIIVAWGAILGLLAFLSVMLTPPFIFAGLILALVLLIQEKWG